MDEDHNSQQGATCSCEWRHQGTVPRRRLDTFTRVEMMTGFGIDEEKEQIREVERPVLSDFSAHFASVYVSGSDDRSLLYIQRPGALTYNP